MKSMQFFVSQIDLLFGIFKVLNYSSCTEIEDSLEPAERLVGFVIDILDVAGW